MTDDPTHTHQQSTSDPLSRAQPAASDSPVVPTAVPLNPRTPLPRRPRTWLAAGTAVLMLVVAVLVWSPWRTVRVSDGSTVLNNELPAVHELIRAENEHVTESGAPFVSIAYMLPMNSVAGDPNSNVAIRHQVEGAYLAQYWANHGSRGPTQFDTDVPLIRVLLADTGPLGKDWPATVDELADRVGGDDKLVAVAGLGSSTTPIGDAITALAGRDIPMFGSVITSSELSAKNLVRVSPTNSDEAAAAVNYLQQTEDWTSASAAALYQTYLVQDQASTDSYARDLGNAYRDEFAKVTDSTHLMLSEEGGYDGSVSGAGNALGAHAQRICGMAVRVVFFAGRSTDLRTFLGKLSSACAANTGRTVTVVTGDDADHLVNGPALWNIDGIELIYTGLTTPAAWGPDCGAGTPPGPTAISVDTMKRFCGEDERSYDALFRDSLDDGHAIMGHDAMMTAIEAARPGRGEQGNADLDPTPAALVNELFQINASTPVPGASGWIYFDKDTATEQWIPKNKAVPVIKIDREAKPAFDRLSSRDGTPSTNPS